MQFSSLLLTLVVLRFYHSVLCRSDVSVSSKPLRGFLLPEMRHRSGLSAYEHPIYTPLRDVVQIIFYLEKRSLEHDELKDICLARVAYRPLVRMHLLHYHAHSHALDSAYAAGLGRATPYASQR